MSAVYEESAEVVYDLLNTARGKDYVGEAAAVADIIRRTSPDARTLLDVGCGTGRHLVAFTELGLECEGVDISEAMLQQARPRLGTTRLHAGDMRTFELGRQFDAVVVLNGGLGYMTRSEDLAAAAVRIVGHVAEGGVVVAEPWFSRQQWNVPLVSAESAREAGVAVARVSRATVEDGLGVFEWVCSVATHQRAWSFSETHRLGLYDIQEYVDAFARCGLSVTHEPLDVGRGLGVLVGTRGAQPLAP